MKRRERPLSPHLQIYKPQLTSVLSIMHRMTGVVLAVGCLVLIGWFFSLSQSVESYECFVNFIRSWFGRVLLMGWLVSFYYHLANGLRHLYWDLGKGYDLPTTYRTGWMVLGVTSILSCVTGYLYIFGE